MRHVLEAKPWPIGTCCERESSCCWRTVTACPRSPGKWVRPGRLFASGESGSSRSDWKGCATSRDAAGCRFFPPVVATHLVKLACELPDKAGRSLSLWTCAELARTAIERGVVGSISPQSVQRILFSQKLKPWRVHHWLSPKVKMDEAFRATVLEILSLYTRPLDGDEQVWSLDEKTSLQPRTRSAPNRPARPGGVPVLVEHEYERKGALQLFAAFDTRTGKVVGLLRRKKRQREFIELLDAIDAKASARITTIHVVCDNASIHKGKLVQAWLACHPRFRMHYTPVHCSWMNQVEQWFSILQRKRLTAPNFPDLSALRERVLAFIREWNLVAHPFNWTVDSFDKVLAKIDAATAAAA